MTPRRTRTHTIGGKRGATCAELLALLNTYVDGGVAPAVCKELESHLVGCNPCRVVVDNIRNTITLYRRNTPGALPAGFSERLHAALRECWKAPPPRRKRA